MPFTVTVNTAELAAEEANYLHQLIETADFFHLSDSTDTSAQPDRYEYEITVAASDRTHTVTYEETSIPDPVRSLIQWLLAR